MSLLKKVRKTENITQKEIAQLLEINSNYYSMIETGQRTPSLKLAKKIADIFNVTVEQIFFN